MTDTDKFVQECFLPFYQRVFNASKQKHYTLFTVLSSFLAGKKNRIGIRLTENERTIGEYTLHLEGVNLDHIECGALTSEVNIPLGVIRPYVILEKNAVERMIADEKNFISDPFETKMKYFRDTTIKFL